MNAVGMSDIGKHRQNNEDVYYIPPSNDVPQVYVVADGMGGCNAGEVASQLAMGACVSYVHLYQSETKDISDLLVGAVQCANQVVFEKAQSDERYAQMGTTIVVAMVEQNKLYVAHAGDSRAYLIQNGQIQQLTTDHSYVMELLKKGAITKEEAVHHPKRSAITRAIGIQEWIEVDLSVYDVKKGDLILLCTDGLSNMLTDTQMLTIIQQNCDIQQKSTKLIETANAQGGLDNITLVLMEV